MKNLRNLALVLFALTTIAFVFSCKEKEERGPYMSITPLDLILYRNSGDLLEFSFNCQAGDHELRNLRITHKPENGVTSVILDTVLYGREAEFFYVYHVPHNTDRVLLTFTLYDTDGKSFRVLRDLYVNEGSYLTETTGHDLYSVHATGQNNAFQISNLTFHQLETNPDSSLIDLVEKDLTNDGQMSRALTSLSGIRFVRNNSFNYAQASATSAANSYTSSNAQQLITDIAVNDILITRYDTVLNKYAVIKITGIYDEEGTALDRYTFSIKK
ncbi:MAG TPA: hypothetical protein VIK71_03060 [Flavobacteriales bacterium]|jgi:hypothetical protein